MQLLLITTIIATLAFLAIFVKFWRYKKYAKKEIESRDQQISEIAAEKDQMLLDLQQAKSEASNLRNNKGNSKFTDNILNKNRGGGNISEDLKPLLDEIEILRKEKEEEMKLRLEAEKQIELALQKTGEIQKRMDDWKIIQDASMKDSKNAIIDVGNDLYQKLAKSHKTEFEEERNLIDHGIKNVSSYLEQISKKIEFLEKNNVEFTKEMKDVIANSSDKKTFISQIVKTAQNAISKTDNNIIDETKDLTNNLETLFKDHGYKSKKDYVFDHDIDDHEKSKLMFSDCIFVKQNQLYIFDFKSQHYFENYKINSKKLSPPKLTELIQEKLDKYILYLCNPKYKNSILKVASSYDLKFDKVSIIALVLSPKEIKITEELGYFTKFSNHALKILAIEEANKIISI